MRLRNVILASHGALCEGMKDSLRMIAGEEIVKDVRTYSLHPGENAIEFAQELKREIESHPEEEYIVITDVLGGSVHTSMLQILGNKNIKLFTGMNLAMTLEIVTSTEVMEGHENHYLEVGRNGIMFTENIDLLNTESEDF
ncbi:PTS sugar transporter subunit IIA [Amedibacillus sp. YH-ame6]